VYPWGSAPQLQSYVWAPFDLNGVYIVVLRLERRDGEILWLEMESLLQHEADLVLARYCAHVCDSELRLLGILKAVALCYWPNQGKEILKGVLMTCTKGHLSNLLSILQVSAESPVVAHTR
jgi:hypothetical protein